MDEKIRNDAYSIVFGFGRKTDERSLEAFIERFADKEFMKTLLPRLQDEDITDMVNFLTGIMRKHLSEKEYHRLFLAE